MVKTIPATFDGKGFSLDEPMGLPVNTRVQIIVVVPDLKNQTLVTTTVKPSATVKMTEKIQAIKQLRGQLGIAENLDTLRQLDLQKLNRLHDECAN